MDREAAGKEKANEPATSTLIDWYSEGESRVVEVDGVRVTIRFVGRKGRRGRILIEAPAGAAFSSFSLVTAVQRVIGSQNEVGRSSS